MPEAISNRQLIIYGLAILLIGILLGSVSITYPFGRDQGIYAYIGQLLREGKIQYKYAFDLKPPGVHYVFALGQSALGESMFSMRIFDILWQSFTAFVLFIITFNLSNSKVAGLLSSIVYIFLYYRLDYWHTLQADGFLNMPFSLSILFLITASFYNSDLRVLFSGVFFGVTLLFKYTLIIFLPIVFLLLLIKDRNLIKYGIRGGAFFLFGLVIVLLVVFGLYYLTDSLSQFIDIQFVQIPLYAKIGYDTESINFILANTFRLFFGSVYSPLILFSALLIIYLIWSKKIGYDKIILTSWMLCTLFNLLIQWKFFLYHFLVIIPPFAVGTAVFLSIIFKEYKLKYSPVLKFSGVILLLIYLFVASKPYYKNYTDLFSYIGGEKNLEQLYIQNGVTSDSAFMIENTFKAVDYVKSNTDKSDGVYVWGFDPLIYYLSGRECVSRFIYNYPLYWKENDREFQKEFMNKLNSHAPKLILVSQNDPLYFISGYHEDSRQILNRFPEFKNFLDNNYAFKTQINNFCFYGLNERKNY